MSSTERWRSPASVALAVAMGLGILVRAIPVLGAHAAIGDGGLVHAMVEDLRAAGLALPRTTSYNVLDIPFTYPPAALYLAAGVGSAVGASTMDLLRWLPLLLSVLCLAAFMRLAWLVLPPAAAIGASLAYALMPHAYDWVVAGGGLTRGAGLLLSLLAIGMVVRRPELSSRSAALGGLLLGGAFLSHPQAAAFGVVGCLVLSWQRPFRAWATRVGIAAVVAVAVVMPWLVPTIAAHGVDSLLSPANRLEPMVGLVRLLSLRFSGAPFMDLFAVFGVVGVAFTVVHGPRSIPVLLLVTYLVGAGGGEFLGAVPWALAAGVGALGLLALVHPSMHGRPGPSRYAAGGVAAGLLFLALIGSVGSMVDRSSRLQSLTGDHVGAMRWLDANTSRDASILVPTDDVWGEDEISEWLPALSHRTSVGTVQGSEWLGAATFEERVELHGRIRACSGASLTCYEPIAPHALLFVPKGRLAGPLSAPDCCPALRETLAASERYRVIYDGPGATIAEPVRP